MDSPVSLKDQIWFLRMCHRVSNVLYQAGRRDAGHKIANRPYAHGSSRTLVTAKLRALVERDVFASGNGAAMVQLVCTVIFTRHKFYGHGGRTVTGYIYEGMKSGTTERSLHL